MHLHHYDNCSVFSNLARKIPLLPNLVFLHFRSQNLTREHTTAPKWMHLCWNGLCTLDLRRVFMRTRERATPPRAHPHTCKHEETSLSSSPLPCRTSVRVRETREGVTTTSPGTTRPSGRREGQENSASRPGNHHHHPHSPNRSQTGPSAVQATTRRLHRSSPPHCGEGLQTSSEASEPGDRAGASAPSARSWRGGRRGADGGLERNRGLLGHRHVQERGPEGLGRGRPQGRVNLQQGLHQLHEG